MPRHQHHKQPAQAQNDDCQKDALQRRPPILRLGVLLCLVALLAYGLLYIYLDVH